MTLTCANCGKPFETDRSWPGDLVPCPSCGANVDLVAAETNIPELSPSLMGEDRPLKADKPLAAGSRVGQYVVEKLVGRGGMGAVYRARHTMLDRDVAVKVLPPEFAADPDFVNRFKREAMALAKLQHPHIVGVHDMGVQGEIYYFVMEFVEGVDLRRLLRDRSLRPEQALSIVPKLCGALEYAHARGIVHRDIKPENIIIDTAGEPKIADFGLAKIVRGERGRTLITHTDVVMGTPDYMAPEQREVTKTADHRADIYSMGVVFYEMLTGELPVGRFDPPSRKVQVDVRLDEVVLRALENSPEKRYQRAGEMGDDVTRITSAPKAPPRTASPARRVLAVSGCILSALVVQVLGVVAWIALRSSAPERPPPKMVAPDASPTRPPATSSRLEDDIHDLIFDPSAAPIEDRLREAEALCAGSRDPAAARLLGVIARERGQWNWWHGSRTSEEDYAAALLYFDRILEADPQDARALTERGLTYTARARFRVSRGLDTSDDLTRATHDLTRAISLEESADAWRGLGDVFGLRGDAVTALERYGRAVELAPASLEARFGRAPARLATGDSAGAFEDLDRAAALQPTSPLPYIMRAALKLQAGRATEAASDYETAIGLDPALQAGPVGEQYAQALATKAGALDAAGRTQEAVAAWTEALRISPDHGMFLISRADLLRKMGRRQEALDDFDAAVAAGAYELEARRHRATLYDSMGRTGDAIADLEWCVSFKDNPIVESDRRTLEDLRARQ